MEKQTKLWTKLFEVIEPSRLEKINLLLNGSAIDNYRYLLKNKMSDEVIGKYHTYKYAASRARYLYKKYVKAADKVLLG